MLVKLGYNKIMIISLLDSLECKADWMHFFRRDHPYCLVKKPAVLVDFQSTFLQLTCFVPGQTDAQRYTLGSRTSLEPAWQLIKGCQWSLTCVMDGLESLNFNTNVRDNNLINLPRDLSVRKSFARESRLAPLLTPSLNETFSPETLALKLRNEQFSQLESLNPAATFNIHSLIISLSTQQEDWKLIKQDNHVTGYYRNTPLIAVNLIQSAPKRHLRNHEISF